MEKHGSLSSWISPHDVIKRYIHFKVMYVNATPGGMCIKPMELQQEQLMVNVKESFTAGMYLNVESR